MKVVLAVLAVLVLALIEGSFGHLYKNKLWKEMTVYTLLIIAGLGIIVMDIVYVSPFRVTKVIDLVFRPYFAAVKSLLLRI
ncbi:MAG TPA: hypothetical protein GXX39_00315 [Syntrophothermus lipocalidus]|uniref:hypothetical protein n=1 Tax=Syntrophothermus TaxID=129001 RepID=UPI0002F477C5|nr:MULTISPECIES: hypothetical protein [Syntrophothermus]NSW83066.1 hypothetical protein [Syntrophothermus sp.]HHV75804.1 hypothetical protein [Syntrophothermus lipocalidus]